MGAPIPAFTSLATFSATSGTSDGRRCSPMRRCGSGARSAGSGAHGLRRSGPRQRRRRSPSLSRCPTPTTGRAGVIGGSEPFGGFAGPGATRRAGAGVIRRTIGVRNGSSARVPPPRAKSRVSPIARALSTITGPAKTSDGTPVWEKMWERPDMRLASISKNSVLARKVRRSPSPPPSMIGPPEFVSWWPCSGVV
jgi:hypothetical protein